MNRSEETGLNRAQRRALARRSKPCRASEPPREAATHGAAADPRDQPINRELWLPPETWEVIRDQAEDFLALVEDHGIDVAEQWLRVRGLAYEVVRR